MTERRLTVAGRHTVADQVIVLDLRDPAGAALPGWAPGAHIDLILASRRERQYSLCGDPSDPVTWRIAVLREAAGRGGSQEIHDTLAVGAHVQARGPRNHFRLERGGRYIFIAGGIGITPILPMLAAAQSAGQPWTLHYGGRTSAAMAFSRDLVARYGTRVRIHPQDVSGLLDLPAILGRPAGGTLVYCCGPGPLLDAVQQHCRQWPEGALHMERFTPPDQPVRPGHQQVFEVELAQAGLTLAVAPDRSILETLQDAGVPVLFSCAEGTCGTCETAVLDGIPDHRDSVLTAAERAGSETMMICVSRSVTPRLVLDL
jgi:ferredoxin-NADP reductase